MSIPTTTGRRTAERANVTSTATSIQSGRTASRLPFGEALQIDAICTGPHPASPDRTRRCRPRPLRSATFPKGRSPRAKQLTIAQIVRWLRHLIPGKCRGGRPPAFTATATRCNGGRERETHPNRARRSHHDQNDFASEYACHDAGPREVSTSVHARKYDDRHEPPSVCSGLQAKQHRIAIPRQPAS